MWKIALRARARDKSYALINVAGLAQSFKAARAHPVHALRNE